MKIRILLAALLAGVGLAVVPSASAAAHTQLAEYFLAFSSATDTFTFGVDKAGGDAGALTVDTRDCCIAGDLWEVTFDTAQPANPANDVSATGNGSITTFSGAATSHPFIRGDVTVSYSDGVDIFPAGMCVRFQYTGSPGVVITPPAGASPGC